MPRTAFKLALRQTEGLMTSVLTLMDLTLSAPGCKFTERVNGWKRNMAQSRTGGGASCIWGWMLPAA